MLTRIERGAESAHTLDGGKQSDKLCGTYSSKYSGKHSCKHNGKHSGKHWGKDGGKHCDKYLVRLNLLSYADKELTMLLIG